MLEFIAWLYKVVSGVLLFFASMWGSVLGIVGAVFVFAVAAPTSLVNWLADVICAALELVPSCSVRLDSGAVTDFAGLIVAMNALVPVWVLLAGIGGTLAFWFIWRLVALILGLIPWVNLR